MAAKNAAKPRPSKNSDGQNKQPVPTMSHDINISPAPPEAPPAPPGVPAPGATNPLTHPNHPAMQSSLGQPQQPQPGTAPSGPTAKPADQRQVQERIQFKDLPAPAQSQVEQQQGIDPYSPLRMVQQETSGAIQGGASTGPLPNMLAGPYVPPGVEAFPDDFAHLSTLMQQGFAPGASAQEHEFGQNAHALAKAKVQQAFSNAQDGVGQQQAQPYAPQQPMQPGAAPPGVSLSAGIPGPQMQASPDMTGGAPSGAPPAPQGPPPGMPPGPMGMPTQPVGPGGIPPALIAAMLAKHKPVKR